MRQMLDRVLDKASNIDARLIAVIAVVPATIVYWSILVLVLNFGLMPATIAGCLLLALSLVLLDRGISLFIQWTSGSFTSPPTFIAV